VPRWWAGRCADGGCNEAHLNNSMIRIGKCVDQRNASRELLLHLDLGVLTFIISPPYCYFLPYLYHG
jgi:hypothetical protein